LNTKDVQFDQLYKLGKEHFSKTDPTRIQENNKIQSKNKNLFTFLGDQKSKE
jgi:hypothetical protein